MSCHHEVGICNPPSCSIPAHADLERRLAATVPERQVAVQEILDLRDKVADLERRLKEAQDDFTKLAKAHVLVQGGHGYCRCHDALEEAAAKLASADQRAREVAGEMQEDFNNPEVWMDAGTRLRLKKWASHLLPEPPAEKIEEPWTLRARRSPGGAAMISDGVRSREFPPQIADALRLPDDGCWIELVPAAKESA